MPKEPVFFHEGLGQNSRSAIQSPGYLQTCENIIFRKDGQQELRPKYSKMNTNGIAPMKSLHRFNNVMYGHGGTGLHGATAVAAFTSWTSIATPVGTARFWFDQY